MDRRSFLTVGAGVCSCLGGCLNQAGVGADPTETQPTTGSPRSETPTGSTQSPPESIQEEASSTPTRTPIDLPPCPSKPTNLTEERAARFAIAFERAYRSRVIYSPDLIKLQLDIPDSEELIPTATDDGYLVHFRVWQADTTRGGGIGDWYYSVRYFISTESVYRLEQQDEFEDPLPDPREDGSAVSCPPQASN